MQATQGHTIAQRERETRKKLPHGAVTQYVQGNEANAGRHTQACTRQQIPRTLNHEPSTHCGLPHTDPTFAQEVAHERVVEQKLSLPRKIPCLLTCAQMQSGGTSAVTGPLTHDTHAPVSWALQMTRLDSIQVRQVT